MTAGRVGSHGRMGRRDRGPGNGGSGALAATTTHNGHGTRGKRVGKGITQMPGMYVLQKIENRINNYFRSFILFIFEVLYFLL